MSKVMTADVLDNMEDWEREVDETSDGSFDSVGGAGFARTFDFLIQTSTFEENEKMKDKETGKNLVQLVWSGDSVQPANGVDYSEGYTVLEEDGAKKVNLSIGGGWDVTDEGLGVEGTGRDGKTLTAFWATTGYGRMLKAIEDRKFPGVRLFLRGLFEKKVPKVAKNAAIWNGCIVRIGPERYLGMDNKTEKVRDRPYAVVGWDTGTKLPEGCIDFPAPSLEQIWEDYELGAEGVKARDEAKAKEEKAVGNGKAGPVKSNGPVKTAAPVKAAATPVKATTPAPVKSPVKAKGKTPFAPEVEAKLVAAAGENGDFKTWRTALLMAENSVTEDPAVMAFVMSAANYELVKG